MGFEDVPASQNPYTYCENDPVNKVDPDGEFALAFALIFAADASFIPVVGWIAAAVVLTGVAIYEGYSIYQDYQTNAKTNERSQNPPAKRDVSSTKKEAYQKAKKAGKGEKPRHDTQHDPQHPHYHPDVSKLRGPRGPKAPSPHDHYYYPKR